MSLSNDLRSIRNRLCLRSEFFGRSLKIDARTLEKLEAGEYDEFSSEIAPRLLGRLQDLGWWPAVESE